MLCVHLGCIQPATQQRWLGRSGKIAGMGWSMDYGHTGFKHKAKQGKHWAQHSLSKLLWLYLVCNEALVATHIQMFNLILQVASLEKLIPVELYAVWNVQRCTRYKSGMNSPLSSFPYENTESNPLFPIQTLFKWKTIMTGNESAAGNNNTWATPALQLRKQQHLLCGFEGCQGPTLPTPSQLGTSWIITWFVLPLVRLWRYPCHLWKLFMPSVQCTD